MRKLERRISSQEGNETRVKRRKQGRTSDGHYRFADSELPSWPEVHFTRESVITLVCGPEQDMGFGCRYTAGVF